jgi:predicted RNase H-like HicB family nuclease
LLALTAGGERMLRYFTLEYWIEDDWYIGKLKEIPGVFSQGETLQELEDNIREAYHLMLEEE